MILKPVIEKRVATRLRGYKHPEFDDIVQSVLISTWNTIEGSKDAQQIDPSQIYQWLATVIRNKITDVLKKDKDASLGDILAAAESGKDTHTLTPAEDDDAIYQSQEREAMLRVVDKLPPHIKEVVLLHYYQGMKIQDIANQFQVPIGTVKSYLRQGREALRQKLTTTPIE